MAIGRIVQNTGIYHGLSLFVKMLHNAEFTRIVHHHSRLYPLSLFVFIYVYIIRIWGKNWGIIGVIK